jgi:NAD(P)-dependent dehydrogenase (short-subunit alcohol dehydrogenase family)
VPNSSDRPTPSDGVAWITGASTGIGRALALRLARDGWTVAATARSADKLEALATEATGRIVPVPGDVTADRAPHAMAARIEAEIGPIALCVVCAGTHDPDGAFGLDLDAFRRVIELNLIAAVACAAAAADRMRPRRSGQIALVASVAGYRGLPGAVAYGGSKAALRNIAEALAFDLGPAGIGLQIINPGFVRTPLTDQNDFPMPFLIEADKAADIIARGLRSRRFEIAFPRPFVLILKALRLLPPRLYIPLIGWATRRRARPEAPRITGGS